MFEMSNDASPSRMNILIIGTLDTKATEIGHLAALIEAQGATAMIMDSSTRDRPVPPAGREFIAVTRHDVAEAAGTTIEAVSALERGEAVSTMRRGVAVLTVAMAAASKIHGAVCIGGAGAHLAGPAFQALELGFPKLIVSPLASGSRTFEPYVGLRDVAVLHSVADIAGVNAVTAPIYREAAGYIVGAARAFPAETELEELGPAIAVSMNGNTTPALSRATGMLESRGLSCVSFHANGTGGRALEDFVESGRAVAVLDYTTTELSAHVVGGLMDSGADRMESAGRNGVPQVLVPGCIDFITCGRWSAAEKEFPGRRLYGHNPELTLVRLTSLEMRQMGQIFAAKANKAVGPTIVCVPLKGFSVPDAAGGPFWDPDADAGFVTELKLNLSSHVRLRLVDAHVNDDDFVDVVVADLMGLIELAETSASKAQIAS